MSVTHDLPAVAQLCQWAAVRCTGRIGEHGTVREVFTQPQPQYPVGLLAAIPRLAFTGAPAAGGPS